jgi:hypothetical protein
VSVSLHANKRSVLITFFIQLAGRTVARETSKKTGSSDNDKYGNNNATRCSGRQMNMVTPDKSTADKNIAKQRRSRYEYE